MHTTDQDDLLAYRGERQDAEGWVRFVYGNDYPIKGCTNNLEAIVPSPMHGVRENHALRYEFPDIDCSSFVPPRQVEGLLATEPTDGLIHVLEFRGADGTVYEGPTPFMVQRNAIGFLQRENGIADARRRGYRWR